jgi:hypothetical protein
MKRLTHEEYEKKHNELMLQLPDELRGNVASWAFNKAMSVEISHRTEKELVLDYIQEFIDNFLKQINKYGDSKSKNDKNTSIE